MDIYKDCQECENCNKNKVLYSPPDNFSINLDFQKVFNYYIECDGKVCEKLSRAINNYACDCFIANKLDIPKHNQLEEFMKVFHDYKRDKGILKKYNWNLEDLKEKEDE